MSAPTQSAAQAPASDEVRLAVLRSYRILDTPPEASFDELARIAATICDTPIAAVSLIDEHRQWFKATHGLQVRETDISISFCAHAVRQFGLYQIEDASVHPLYAGNPLVTGEPNIRFYAGSPLVTPEGVAVGTLMVIDRIPRTLTSTQQSALSLLARQVIVALELHRQRTRLREQLDEQARDHAQLYELAANVAGVGYWGKDYGSPRLHLTPEAQEMLEVDAADPLPDTLARQVGSDQRAAWRQALAGCEDGTAIMDMECDWQRSTDRRITRWLAIRRRSAMPGRERLLGLVVDVTEQRRMALETAEAVERYKSAATLLDQAHDAIIVKDLQDRIEFWNAGAERLYGWTAAEALGHSELELLHEDAATFEEVGQVLSERGEHTREIVQQHRDGHRIDVLAHWTQVSDDNGEPRAVFSICTDITQSRRDQERIRQLAFYDQLTQLPNRTLLMERLQRAIIGCRRHGQQAALMFIDLDNFKSLNDTLGHAVGDQLLQQVAVRLQQSVRSADTVARQGGDEFVILLEELGDDPKRAAIQAETASRKVVAALRKPFPLDDHAHLSTGSIGVTLFDGTDVNVDDLLKQADIAMYEAKQAGRNGVRFFDPQMQQMVVRRASLENALRRAEIRKEFLLHYQPQWLRDGTLTGFEALVRWMHPQRGLLEPGEFISAAEETGVILSLGQWVLDRACQQLAEWASVGRPLRVSVNVSAAQLHAISFVDEVREALTRHGTPPALLTLELTESMLVRDVNATVEKMARLRELGVRVALDDFGTGYSSLSLLQRLPLDDLKIDASFVHRMTEGARERQMVQAIVMLGKNMALNIIAEGIETEGQQTMLEHLGCDGFQGFLHGRSMPAADAQKLALTH